MTDPCREARAPERMCVICRERHPKQELARYIRDPDGNMIFDAEKNSPGRGWYVCGREACLSKFEKFRPKPRRRGKVHE